MILPPVPEPALIFPAVILPVTPNVPVIFAPVPVITNTFALPTALILTLPLLEGILTLLLPFDIPAVVMPVKYIPLPVKKLADTLLPKLALPEVMLPVTAKLVSVPTLVIFGCAAVYTVPAINALPTCPETLAPAIELNPDPLPVNTPVLAVILAAIMLPFTDKLVNVPTLVTCV